MASKTRSLALSEVEGLGTTLQTSSRAQRGICFLLASLAFVALGAAANPADTLGYDDARHLLARTGFGPTDAEVRAFAPLTRRDAVASLLRDTRTSAVTPPPAAMLDTPPLRPPRGEMSSVEQRQAFVREQARQTAELRGWWVGEMLATPSPLTERMTLFWHNHFVSSQQKVRVARLMYRQNVLLREHALGRFDTLLHAIARDPAMVIYLDSLQNRKGAPNENFAREVMELFTLGEGHYSEADIKEAARAFTGWSLERETGAFRFRPLLHDDGTKTVFGKSGRFDGDDVLDLLLARPETSEFIVSKLWREFVSPEPDKTEVRRIAKRFRDSRYDIKVAVGELLTSDAFYAPDNRGVLVKSPVDVVVGSLHQLGIAPDTGLPFAFAAAGMGQLLLAPPNVRGWPGGDVWINTQTLLARKQFLDRLTRADDTMAIAAAIAMSDAPMSERRAELAEKVTGEAARVQRMRREMNRGLAQVHFDSARFAASLPGATADERGRAAQRLLVAVPPVQAVDTSSDSASVVRALVLDAAYELK
jgi:uncharacterized protein (DUF1800 family)